MIFVTLGTTFMKFDRLVKAVDLAIEKQLIDDEIFAQIGNCDYLPKNYDFERVIDKLYFDTCFQKADLIIGHAGMGTINMALEYDKPLLVVPREKRFNEHVNDHQLWTAEKFEALGHVVCCNDLSDIKGFVKKIRMAKTFVRKKRENKADDLAKDIVNFLGMDQRN